MLAVRLFLGIALAGAAVSCSAQSSPQTDPPREDKQADVSSGPPSEEDTAAIFEAAGFRHESDEWHACGDPSTDSYTPGWIEKVGDLNGDGRPEAIVMEGSLFCFGSTEVGYTIVSRQADGAWTQIASGPGSPSPLATKGEGGWPDLEIGGPGFCFPVERWNGSEYALDRFEYEGKACKPPG